MFALTPGQGPGRHRHRAGMQTRAYIKNNNNKNLLALQTAQPAQGDRLAWHFQTSWTYPNSGETGAPSHTRRRSLQQCSTARAPEPPFQEHNSHPPPPNPTTFQPEICFASLFLKEGLLSPLKLCTPRSRRGSGAGGAPFFGCRRQGSVSPQERGLGEAGNSTVSHAGQAADPGGLLRLTLQNQNCFQTPRGRRNAQGLWEKLAARAGWEVTGSHLEHPTGDGEDHLTTQALDEQQPSACICAHPLQNKR